MRWVLAMGLLVTLGGSEVRAAVLVQWTFEGGTPGSPVTSGQLTPATTASNMTSTLLSLGVDPGASVTYPNVEGLTTGAGNPGQGMSVRGVFTETNDLAGALSRNKYIEFTVTPNVGYQLDLSTLTLDLQRFDATSATSFTLRSSLDSYATNIGTITGFPTNPTAYANFSFSLSAPAYQGLTSSITFRIYEYGASAALGAVRHDNLTLNGDVVVIPEPSTYALVMAGLAVLLVLGRSGRRRAEG